MSEQPGCRRSGNSGEFCGGLLHILQSGVVFLAGADLDHAGHVVDKDLAIADMAGVQGLLGGLHHSVYADAGDDDFHLDLGQQGGIHRHAAVLFRRALLDAAAHDLRYGHAGDAQIIQGGLELIELCQLCNDGHLVHTGVVDTIVDHRLAHHRHGSIHLLCRSLGDIVLAQIGVLVGGHGSGVCIRDGKACISRSQTVLVDVQTVDLHLGRHTQAKGLINDLEDDEHYDHNVGIHADQTQQLGTQLLGLVCVDAYVVIVMFIIFKIIDKTLGLRVPAEVEIDGLDIHEHGLASAYAGFAISDANSAAMTPNENTDLGEDDVTKASAKQMDAAVPVVREPVIHDGVYDTGMHKVSIIAKLAKFDQLKTALNDLGVTGMTVTQVMGCGIQKGTPEKYRGVPVDTTLLPKIKVEVIVSRISVDAVVEAAKKALYTGHIGDGKIFVYNVTRVVKIRTGEEDYAALQDVE